MAINDGNHPITDSGIPGVTYPAGSGAQGTAGAMASETAGSVVGSPVVSTPYASSQLSENMPRLPVLAGDTSAMSDDMPVSAGPGVGGPVAAAYMDTGAGHGGVGGPAHPNAGR